jgi:hypothetical protein
MKTVFGPVVDDVMRDLTGKLGEMAPELQAILDTVRAGDLEEEEAMALVLELLRQNPEIAKQIEVMAETTLAPLRITEPGDGIVVPPPSGIGMHRLDPLYEAHLQERVQLDGDAPELRFGALPRGVAPAVPVDTTALNPVAVGMMLQTASEEVASEMLRIEDTRINEVQKLLGGASEEEAALVFQDPANLARLERDTLPDPVGYERRTVPALRAVEQPTGWGLLALTPEQQQQLAWKTLSTTQGRRSMVKVIRDLIGGGLRNDQYDVEVAEGELRRTQPGDILTYAEWTADLAGPNSTQASFAFADVAWRSLFNKLTDKVAPADGPVTLEVSTINTVDVRRVGFCARLLRGSK